MPATRSEPHPDQAAPPDTSAPGAAPTAPAPSIQELSQVSSVAWNPRGDLDRASWQSAGRKLGAIGRGSQWWIGDWIRYGNAQWGERYAEAAEITGYDVGSLRNMAWVSSQFEPSLRSDNLTWSHHVLLAPLDEDEKRAWLDHAVQKELSVSGLRTELGVVAPAGTGKSAEKRESEPNGHEPVTCPKCGHQLVDA